MCDHAEQDAQEQLADKNGLTEAQGHLARNAGDEQQNQQDIEQLHQVILLGRDGHWEGDRLNCTGYGSPLARRGISRRPRPLPFGRFEGLTNSNATGFAGGLLLSASLNTLRQSYPG